MNIAATRLRRRSMRLADGSVAMDRFPGQYHQSSTSVHYEVQVEWPMMMVGWLSRWIDFPGATNE